MPLKDSELGQILLELNYVSDDDLKKAQAAAEDRQASLKNTLFEMGLLTQDLFEADISQATVVTLFLLPRLNQELIPKLRRELRPGTRIVSHQFDMGDRWPPEHSQDVNGLMIYVWTIR